MSLMKQLLIYSAVCYIGDICSTLIHKTIPATIIDMFILLLLLGLKWIKVSQIQEISNFLVTNMAFFFIPNAIAMVQYIEVLKSCIVAFLAICFVSTILAFAVTAITTSVMMRMLQRRD